MQVYTAPVTEAGRRQVCQSARNAEWLMPVRPPRVATHAQRIAGIRHFSKYPASQRATETRRRGQAAVLRSVRRVARVRAIVRARRGSDRCRGERRCQAGRAYI